MVQDQTKVARGNGQVILFDLDGTLLDTGLDMGAALNALLEDNGRPAVPYHRIRPKVSHGANALIELGFEIGPQEPRFEDLRQGFLQRYQQNLCVHTCLFDGMECVLSYLERRQRPWGIVTNKHGYLTTPLLQELGLLRRAASVVSGDTLEQRKPHPAPLLHACQLAGGNPASSIYIGDAQRDIEAGRNAGMTTLVAGFGYLGNEDRPQTWGADGMIDRPQDIFDWIA